MTGSSVPKDILFAFFGLFLSIVFTQGLFKRIVEFIVEFSYSVIPFQYSDLGAGNDKLTKELIEEQNKFEIDRSSKLRRIYKSIYCNAAIAMSVIVTGISAASFSLVGLPVTSFGTLWEIFLSLVFVYSFYFFWSLTRDSEYWSNLPPMSGSRYEMILTISATIFIFYSILLYRGAFSGLVFYIFSLLVIFLITRCYRIPHLNATYRRAEDFVERESFYLKDIGKEFFIVLLLFVVLSTFHFQFFESVGSTYLAKYVELHPVRIFLVLLCLPSIAFLRAFLLCVNWRSLLGFLIYFDRRNWSK